MNTCLVLHPKYKSRYFRQQKWEEEWIIAAESLLRSFYEKYYKPEDVIAPLSQEEVSASTTVSPSNVSLLVKLIPCRVSLQTSMTLVLILTLMI